MLNKEVILSELVKHGITRADVNYDINEPLDIWSIIEESEGFTQGVWAEDVGDDDAGEFYEELLNLFEHLSHGAIKFEALESETSDDDQVVITFKIDGKPQKIEFEQYSDSISEEFVDAALEVTKKFKQGRIIEYAGADMPTFGYVPHMIADLLTKEEYFN